MKKNWIIFISIVIVILAIIVGIVTYNANNNKLSMQNLVTEVGETSEKVTDECTEEWEELNEEDKNGIEANSSDEKISPNCLLTLKKYYNNCKHTINEYVDIPNNLINKTQSDLINEYPDWEIKQYSSTQIILYKEFDGECGQHFILKDDGGKITIYRINEENEEEIYEKTEISIDYLTETDKIEIMNGIRVYGKEQLNQLIENFE